MERLGVAPERVHVIHAATSGHFAGMYPSAVGGLGASVPPFRSVRPGFVLYVGALRVPEEPGGVDRRRLGGCRPTMRAKHQLVMVCALCVQARRHWFARRPIARAWAATLWCLPGMSRMLILGLCIGLVGCLCFRRFMRGLGCRCWRRCRVGRRWRRVRRTTGPEVLGDLEGTFEPHDPDSIAACLAGVLGSQEALERLRARSRRRVGEYTWERVAERSIVAYERAVARVSGGRRSRRPADRACDAVAAGAVADRVITTCGWRSSWGGGWMWMWLWRVRSIRMRPPRAVVFGLIDVREFERFGGLRQHDRVPVLHGGLGVCMVMCMGCSGGGRVWWCCMMFG